MLGSCFAANVGARMAEDGYMVSVNPFGTLFNPASIASSLERLASAEPFTVSDCVQMGAGSQLWGSFSHYTKFARPTKEEFLENANQALEQASAFFRECSKVVVTFGTAFVFEHHGEPADGRIVSNCLKRDAKEFRRYMLSVDDIVSMWKPLLEGILADKDVIFTVSPVRHMADTAHGNQLSKSTLLLACDQLLADGCDHVRDRLLADGCDHVRDRLLADGCDLACDRLLADGCDLVRDRRTNLTAVTPLPSSRATAKRAYFPSYEIVLDELRDYSWFAEDLVHPSQSAIDYVWQKFASAISGR